MFNASPVGGKSGLMQHRGNDLIYRSHTLKRAFLVSTLLHIEVEGGGRLYEISEEMKPKALELALRRQRSLQTIYVR